MESEVKKGAIKDHKSSVALIPPEDCWEQIQAIRKVHDKAYVRWMPHINLLYPFLPDKEDGVIFEEASEKAREALSHIQAFKVRFSKDSFGYFRHRKSSTLWLKPLEATKITKSDSDDVTGDLGAAGPDVGQHHSSVLEIQSSLEKAFPEFTDLGAISEAGFQPHLSLGQFQTKDVDKEMEKFKAEWIDLEFEVNEIYLISRADFNDPFHIRHRVPLGKSS